MSTTSSPPQDTTHHTPYSHRGTRGGRSRGWGQGTSSTRGHQPGRGGGDANMILVRFNLM